MRDYIAERTLLCSEKGNNLKKKIIIRLSAPYSVKENDVSFSVGEDGCSACQIQIDGLNEFCPNVYGADSLQAISLAINAIESFLKRLEKKYDFYYLDGGYYFDN